MRAAITAVATAAALVALSTPALANNPWITVGPYPTESSCLVDKQRYNQIYPAWGCYQNAGGWYFQYNRGY